jgi:hypothetical protein
MVKASVFQNHSCLCAKEEALMPEKAEGEPLGFAVAR